MILRDYDIDDYDNTTLINAITVRNSLLNIKQYCSIYSCKECILYGETGCFLQARLTNCSPDQIDLSVITKRINKLIKGD